MGTLKKILVVAHSASINLVVVKLLLRAIWYETWEAISALTDFQSWL